MKCSKCNAKLNNYSKFCNRCGNKINLENEVKSNKFVYIFLFIFIAVIVIFAIPFSYTATEAYNSKEPYSDYEYYTEWVNANNCDSESSCVCQHVSFLGFGSCDSCSCTRQRIITKYKFVLKEREV